MIVTFVFPLKKKKKKEEEEDERKLYPSKLEIISFSSLNFLEPPNNLDFIQK